MPFPYMQIIGALLAATLLGTTLTVFAVVLHAIDRVVTWAGEAAVSGLVSGFRGWSEARRSVPRTSSPRGGDPVEDSLVVPVGPVRAKAGLPGR